MLFPLERTVETVEGKEGGKKEKKEEKRMIVTRLSAVSFLSSGLLAFLSAFSKSKNPRVFDAC